nr:MAG TPA: hypothetical protein [Caudoviricetes sp.]
MWDFSGTFSGLSLSLETPQGHRDILGFVPQGQGHSRSCPSGLSLGFVPVPVMSLAIF